MCGWTSCLGEEEEEEENYDDDVVGRCVWVNVVTGHRG